MKALVQRVRGRTAIKIAEKVQDFYGPGLVVLLVWMQSDALDMRELEAKEQWMREHVEKLRIFPDQESRMNLSLEEYLKSLDQDESGGILWVPQFTLAAKLESGFRPSFSEALMPGLSRSRFERFTEESPERAYSQLFGKFGSDMDLEFTNWGPVTIFLER